MGKQWMAAALAALALAVVCAAPPLARAAKSRTAASLEVPVDETAALAEEPEELAVLDGTFFSVYRELLENGEEPVSRGETVGALYRLSGALVRADGCSYPDVTEADWDAVAWAIGSGVSGGVAEDRFAPERPVSRSQLAVMLHRFAAWRGEDMECRLAVSSENEEIPAYAEEALNWVLDRGLYGNMTDRGLYPALPVSRLQLAEILARLQKDRDPVAASLSLSEEGAASLSREKHDAIEQAVREAARRHGAVGVQVAVIEDGAVTDTYCYGWAVKDSVPMTDRHKMRVASLSKVAVGLSAALLREEGDVDYDADIGDYWGVKTRRPVTIRSMLTHTSTLLNSENLAWDYAGVKSQLGSASGYGGGTPGSLKNWSYNNHAFGILGQTLELASGRFLDDVLKDRLLAPLGADGAFAAGALEHPELITPLYRRGGVLGRSAANQRKTLRWSAPGATGRQFAGGFTISALDCAKLTALLAGDGCFEGVRLMDAVSVELMESHEDTALPGGIYQALPLRLRFDVYGRERIYYHTGSAYGVYNLLSYDPDAGDGVVVLTMGADGGKDQYDIYAVCGEISQAVYEVVK